MRLFGGDSYLEASPMHDHSRSDFLFLALFLGLRAFVAAAASDACAASLRFQQCPSQPSSSCTLAFFVDPSTLNKIDAASFWPFDCAFWGNRPGNLQVGSQLMLVNRFSMVFVHANAIQVAVQE